MTNNNRISLPTYHHVVRVPAYPLERPDTLSGANPAFSPPRHVVASATAPPPLPQSSIFLTTSIHTISKRVHAHLHCHYRHYQNSHTDPLCVQRTINLHRRNIIKILPLLPAINQTFTTIMMLSCPSSPRLGITDYTSITNITPQKTKKYIIHNIINASLSIQRTLHYVIMSCYGIFYIYF